MSALHEPVGEEHRLWYCLGCGGSEVEKLVDAASAAAAEGERIAMVALGFRSTRVRRLQPDALSDASLIERLVSEGFVVRDGGEARRVRLCCYATLPEGRRCVDDRCLPPLTLIFYPEELVDVLNVVVGGGEALGAKIRMTIRLSDLEYYDFDEDEGEAGEGVEEDEDLLSRLAALIAPRLLRVEFTEEANDSVTIVYRPLPVRQAIATYSALFAAAKLMDIDAREVGIHLLTPCKGDACKLLQRLFAGYTRLADILSIGDFEFEDPDPVYNVSYSVEDGVPVFSVSDVRDCARCITISAPLYAALYPLYHTLVTPRILEAYGTVSAQGARP